MGATLGAVLLGGGGATAAVLLGGDSAGGTVNAAGERLAEPLDDTPERAWSFDAGADYVGATVAAGDLLVVSLGESAVVGLDIQDGSEQWRAPAGYPVAASPDGEHVLVSDPTSDGVVSLSTDSGEEEWSFGSGYAADHLGDRILITDDSTVTVLDADSGEEVWDASSTMHRTHDGTVYSIGDGELRALDVTDGTERWSQSIGYSESFDVVPVDGMVVAQVDSVATAYSAEDGAQLWSTTDYAEYRTVEQVAPDMVAITEQLYDDTGSSGSAAVYDATGQVDTITTEDGFLGLSLLSAGGETYAMTYDGRVLDASLEVVARYDGYVVPVDGGVYVGDDIGDVSYYRIPEDTPAWTEPWGVSPDSESYLVPVDGGVAVVEGNRITTYL